MATVCRRCHAPLVSEGAYPAKLVAALDHPEPQTAVRAATILGERRERDALPALVRTLERTDDMVLAEAVCRALGCIGDDSAVPALSRALVSGALPVRLAAVRALTAIGTVDALAALRVGQRDPSRGVREAVKAALDELGARGVDRVAEDPGRL